MAAAPISTPLWQFRSLENWAREIVIKELCPPGGAKVVQYGGGGFDLGKWFVSLFCSFGPLKHCITSLSPHLANKIPFPI